MDDPVVAALAADNIGQRVVVRHTLSPDERGPRGERLTDVLGELVGCDETHVRIRRRDGSVAVIARESVTTAKTLPPAPRRRAAALAGDDELVAVASGCWGFRESAWLGDWLLRAADGFTGRANSATCLGDPGRPLPDALREVAAWYGSRGLPARVQVVAGGELDSRIASLGHHDTDRPALRQVARVEDALAALRAAANGSATAEVSLRHAPDPAWLAVYRGGETPPAARDVLEQGEHVGFAAVEAAPGEPPLAIGRGCLTTSAGRGPERAGTRRWVGLAAIETAPLARRRGLARAVLARLLSWGAENGATMAMLEVEAGNEGALALYRSIGFVTVHGYHNRLVDGSSEQ